MRTITHSEFVNAAGDGVYVSTVHYASDAERKAGDAAVQRVVAAAAFVPFGDKGEPFDPPEEWPSDRTATEYAPQAVSASYTTQAVSGGVTPKTHYNGIPIRLPGGQLNPVAISAVIRKVKADQMPPNCEGYGHTLAHAQHEAAIDGDGCTAGACLLTRGSD